MSRSSYSSVSTAWAATPRRRGVDRYVAVILRRAEYLFAFLGLSALAGSLIVLLRQVGVAGWTGGFDSARLILPLTYLFSGSLLLLRPAALMEAASRHKSTLMLTGLALLSFFWSDAPLLTLKRGGMLIGMTVFALYLVSRFHQRDLLSLLGWVLGIVAVFSVGIALIGPGRGIEGGVLEAPWTGIFDSKSQLGLSMTLGTGVFVAIARRQTGSTWYGWLGAGLCALLVVLSRSATAIVATTCMVLLIPLAHVLRHRGPLHLAIAIWMLILLAAAGLIAFSDTDAAVRLLGKDPSFTGRIPLWHALVEKVWEKPWLGAGYYAFWVTPDGAEARLNFTTWEASHAHDGLLELGLELGIVGVITFLVGYLIAFWQALRRLRSTPFSVGFWPLAMPVLLLVTSVPESMLLRYNSLWWVAYLTTVFSPILSSSTVPQHTGRNAASRMVSDTLSPPTPVRTAVQVARSGASPGVRRLIRIRRTRRRR
jgi:exopolysaccharide production protein ExoQ